MFDQLALLHSTLESLSHDRKIIAAYCPNSMDLTEVAHLMDMPIGATALSAFDQLLPAEEPAGLIAWYVPAEGDAFPLLRRHPETEVDEWQDMPLDRPGLIIFAPAPPAGGGDENGSNPLQMVLMVAVMVLAVYTGGLAAGATKLPATSAGFAAVNAGVTGAVAIAGSFLINALFPPVVPEREELAQGTTFNGQISGQLARQGQRIPEVFGRRRFAPLFLAQPYAEFRGDTNEVFALYSLSVGKVDLEKLEFEDTPIWTKEDGVLPAIKDLEIQICGPNEPVTLFPINVISSAEPNGQVMRGPNEKENGETDDDLFLGPFAVCPPGRVVDRISFDFQLPTGLGVQGANGAVTSAHVDWKEEARQIDDNGDPIGDGSWIELNNRRVTDASLRPVRFSDTYVVDRGRWEARAKRLIDFSDSTIIQDLLTWTGLRGFEPLDQAFEHETVLAVKFTGSAATQTARQLFATATRILPDWDEATQSWIERPTQSIAAAARYLAESPAYGARAEHQIDLAKLQDLQGQVWGPRGDTFNHRFTRDLTTREHLDIVCRAGRTRFLPLVQDVSFVRDQALAIPEMHFAPADIVRGSLKINRRHRTQETPQAARVSFTEPTGARSSVICHLPGHDVSPIADIEFPGVDNHRQAWQEGITEMAGAHYRRRFIEFLSYKRGRPLLPMTLISLTHPRFRAGQAAILRRHDNIDTLFLDQPLQFEPGEQHFVILTNPIGTQFGPVKCTPGQDLAPVDQLNGETLQQAKSIVLDLDDLDDYLAEPVGDRKYHANPFTWMLDEHAGAVPTRISVGPVDMVSHLAQVIEAVPDENQMVPISCVEYRPEVHEAENGPMPAEVAKLIPANTPTAPTWAGVTVTITDAGSGPTLNISGPAQPGATTYHAGYTIDEQTPVTLAPSATPSFSVAIGQGDQIVVEYGAEGSGGQGPVTQVVTEIQHIVPAEIPSADLNLTHDPDHTGSAFQWPAVFAATSYEIELLGDNDGSAHTLRRVLIQTATSYDYTRAQQTEDGGPWRHAKLRVRPASAGGAAPVTERVAFDVPPGPLTGVVAGNTTENSVAVNFTMPVGDTTVLGAVLVLDGVSGFDPNDPAVNRTIVDNPAAGGVTAAGLSPGTTYYARVAAHDGCAFGLNWSDELTLQTDAEEFGTP